MRDFKKNEQYEAVVEGYSSEAFGVCRIDGRAVFLPKALKGERWQLKIVKASANAAYARGERLLAPSPERVEPDCPCFGRCGGCDCRHMSYEEELRFKLSRVNDALTHIGRQQIQAEQILSSEAQSRYRNKAIFAVGGECGRASFGFYRPRSHELIPVRDCLLQTELSCRAAAAVVDFINQKHIAPYDEVSGKGVVRHVYCRQSVHGSDAVVCIVAAKGFGTQTQALVQALREVCPELTGIVLNINKSRGNTVLDGEFYTLWGKAEIVDSICGIQYEIAPRAFFQINPPQAERLYEIAVSFAIQDSGELIFDLYCGAGTISLCLAKKAGKVIGAEIVDAAIENAKQNALQNQISNAEFLCADAGEAAELFAERGLHPDAVVVDPPRKGMDERAVEAVAAMNPSRIVYVSCNPATLARDILHFEALGYALREVVAVDMFPRTCHVESVAKLVRQKPEEEFE